MARVALRVVTINDDFTDRLTDLHALAEKADVLLVQECKHTDVAAVLGDGWATHQAPLRDSGRAGVAVAVRRTVGRVIDRGHQSLVPTRRGVRMEHRWLAWLLVDVDGEAVCFGSAHRPPKRYRHLWAEHDRQVARFIARMRGRCNRVVIGFDANEVHPRGLSRIDGARWRAPDHSIDGFLVAGRLAVRRGSVKRGVKRRSDHRPVRSVVTIPGTNRRRLRKGPQAGKPKR